MSPRAAVAVDGRSIDPALAVHLARLYHSPVSHLLTDDTGRRVTTVQGPLTLELVAHHLAGRRDVGAVPRDIDKRCSWAALDVDRGGLEAADRLRTVLARQLGAAMVFTSSGYTHPDGHHVAVFFKSPVPEAALRQALEAARLEAEVPGAELIIAKGLRLPYYGAAPPGRRVALDTTGVPLSLAEFLAAVERVPAARLLMRDRATSTHASLQSSCALQASRASRLASGDLQPAHLQVPHLQTRPAVLPAVPTDLRKLHLRPARLVGLIQGGWFNGCGYESRSALQQAVFCALARAGHPPAMAWALLETQPRFRERASATGKAGHDLERSIARAYQLVASTADTRRRSRRRFVMLDYAVMGELLAGGRQLDVARAVYVAIAMQTTRSWGYAITTVQQLAKRTGCSSRSVLRGLTTLRRRGFLETFPTDDRWSGSNRPKVAYRLR